MSTTFSSWKEIAAYLGKGVRTVQRWEKQFALPVRRPSSKSHVVFAISVELDSWVKRHCQPTAAASRQHSPLGVFSSEQYRVSGQESQTAVERLRVNRQKLRANIFRLRSLLAEFSSPGPSMPGGSPQLRLTGLLRMGLKPVD